MHYYTYIHCQCGVVTAAIYKTYDFSGNTTRIQGGDTMSAHLLIARSQLQLNNNKQRHHSTERRPTPKKGIVRCTLQTTALLGGKIRRRIGVYANRVQNLKIPGNEVLAARAAHASGNGKETLEQ